MASGWRYFSNGKECGPASEIEVRFHISAGNVKVSDKVLPPGQSEWIPASEAARFYGTAAVIADESPETCASTAATQAGSATACLATGTLFLVVGLYFLFNPSEPGAYGEVSHVANIHRLTIGETLSIVGAIFLAAGLRPRQL